MKAVITDKLGDIMANKISGNKIPLHFIKEALLKQKTLHDKRPLGEILVKDGLISEETVSEALSIQYGLSYLPYINAKPRVNWELYKEPEFEEIFPDFLTLIRKANAFPAFFDDNNNLVIMAVDPKPFDLDLMVVKLNKKFPSTKIVIVPKYTMLDFELYMKRIRINELQEEANKITKASSEEEMIVGEITPQTFLKYMLIYAVVEEASDIHIQPAANGFSRLSIRKQGILETLLYLPIMQMSKIVAAIKNQSKLDPTIVKAPQDGRIDGKELLKDVKFKGSSSKEIRKFDFEEVTLRVSTYPTESPFILPAGTSFESVVMRIFNPKAGLVRLGDLGLSEQVENELNILKDRSQGIILITGPTGSGKSTTLYSALGSIDAISTKIITFEDPVELRQLFWAQGQKNIIRDNPKLNFDYPQAIASMMRQDPDVILLGEIREFQGADFAFKAANTGHMVFSTLHANSSCQAFERLRKIGVDDLMMASAILAVSAQRLVRRVCPHCAEITDIKPSQRIALQKLEIKESIIPTRVTIPSANGCHKCGYKKYIGRLLISEIVPIYNEIRTAIVDKKPDYVIREIADKLGYKTIVQDGINKLSPIKRKVKVKNTDEIKEIEKPGETTINELLRVI